ncbi:MAG: hypothetical protein L3K18_08710 [Thermoplasmata archaeon]|nr:hypothetical protein [Thermoplasmata archaeon]
MPELYRNIYFYHVHAELDDGGDASAVALAPLLRKAAAIPFDGTPSRYLVSGDGDATALWLKDGHGTSVAGRLTKTRRSGLPGAERGGQERDIPLDDGEGLLEPCHFELFDGQFLAYEYNHYGPRASVLPFYIERKLPEDVSRIFIHPILRPNVAGRLREIGEVKLLRLAVARDRIEETRRLSPSLHTAFEAAANTTTAEVVELTLRGEKHSRAKWSLPFGVRKIAAYLRVPEAMEGTQEFVIEADNTRTGEADTFDLLREALVLNKAVQYQQDGKSRRVVSASAYRAIEAARDEVAGALASYRHSLSCPSVRPSGRAEGAS